MSKACIAVADDHPLIVFAIEHKIKGVWPDIQVESAHCYHQLFRILEQKEQQINLAIVDLSMPGSEGIQGVEYICKNYENVPVIVISGYDDFNSCTACLNVGAVEFVSKTEFDSVIIDLISKYLFDDLPQSSRALPQAHEPYVLPLLTPSQRKVLRQMADGLSNKAIARELNISEKTVRVHASAIFKQLDVENRTQAAVKYKRLAHAIEL
ncbi:response regulator transcription factor [Pseudoalteromonas sp. T1lg48]|uniref:response regulator transcription factor n=1 Tax=Pseudoalteromonas sp. T1lg48 TaxID=2077100 RepID=UPI000CF72D8D|nr:response regulator transcription factor [Pseudoalteromonas sp. T1lg48]